MSGDLPLLLASKDKALIRSENNLKKNENSKNTFTIS